MLTPRCVATVLMILVCLAPAAIAADSERPWYERLILGLEIGPTGAQFGSDPSDVGYAARFDGREIVRLSAEAHAQYVVIWARDGEYAYYQSKLTPPCPGMGDRDVLRETVEAARPLKIPVIAYCCLQYPTHDLRQHPDWKMRDKDGNAIDRVCYNSPYIEHVKQLLAEMMSYGIDGFHLDMVDQGFGPPYGCWCDRCRALFEREHGRPMPKGVTWDEDWDRMLSFRYDSSARFEKALREHLRSVNPAITADFNYHGSPPFSWEVGQRPVQHAVTGDFVTGETGAWGFSALGVGLTAEFLSAAKPDAVYQIAMQRGVRMYHDQTTRPLNDIRWELFTLLAHGAQVTVVDKTAYDGWLDPVGYERIGAAFAEALAKREHFGGKRLQDVGLYYSVRSRDWYGREKPAEYQQFFNGAHKALAYEHIPYGVILDENATIERLRQFPVVLLCNAAVLMPEQIDTLRRYVEEGGRLVVTGLTGLCGRLGEPLKESVLAELVGGTLVGRLDSLDNHVRFSEAPPSDWAKLGEGIRPQWPFLIKGPGVIYKATTARPVGELMRPHRTVRQKQGKEGTEWPMSADAPVGPAILVNAVGKGQVVTFACSPDFATGSEHAVVEARKLLRNAIRCLNPSPRVEITAPSFVEAVVGDDPAARKLRVHLLAYVSPPQCTPAANRPLVLPSTIEDTPLYRVKITTRDPFREVKAVGPATKVTTSGRTIEALVDDIHDVLVVSY